MLDECVAVLVGDGEQEAGARGAPEVQVRRVFPGDADPAEYLNGLGRDPQVGVGAARLGRRRGGREVRADAFIVKIFDDDDREVSAGTDGEIVCRPRKPYVMYEGYWRRPEATVTAWRNLWFHTGDIGRIDSDGYLFFVDRKADYMRRRGENISSWELEKVFHEHPDVKDVCVHAVVSDVSEDDVKATVVPKDGSALTEEALCRWAADRLPNYALPRYFEFRPKLPRSGTGRTTKHLLKHDGVTAATGDREAAGVTFERR